MFFIFIPRASLVDTEITKGLSFLKWAFAAIRTGESVIPLHSFASVFPVHGKITRISNRLFGPIGSAWAIVFIGVIPVIFSALSKKSSAFPNRLSMLCAAPEKMVCTCAPSSASFSSWIKIFSYVQNEPVTAIPIFFPFTLIIHPIP